MRDFYCPNQARTTPLRQDKPYKILPGVNLVWSEVNLAYTIFTAQTKPRQNYSPHAKHAPKILLGSKFRVNSGVNLVYAIFTAQATPRQYYSPHAELAPQNFLGVNFAYADFTPPSQIISLHY